MKNVPIWLVLVTMIAVSGCKEKSVDHDPDFVLVDSLVSAKIEHLKSEHYHLKKMVSYKDTTLLKEVDEPNLNHELEPFTRVIIPVVSWDNNYTKRIDTVGNKIIYLYMAKDSSSDLNRFVLHKDMTGRISAMHFNYRTANLFTESDQFLIWEEDLEGNVHYQIEGKQHTRIFGEEVYKVDGILSKIVK